MFFTVYKLKWHCLSEIFHNIFDVIAPSSRLIDLKIPTGIRVNFALKRNDHKGNLMQSFEHLNYANIRGLRMGEQTGEGNVGSYQKVAIAS